MKILHLVHDEKFIHFTANIFSLCEGVSNHFWVVVADPSGSLKYVADLPNMRVIDKRKIRSKALVADLTEFDAVIVHYLDTLKARIVLKVRKSTPIMWSGWGGDYYGYLPTSHAKLLGIETEKMVAQLSQKQTVSKSIKAYLRRLAWHVIYRRVMGKAIHRMDYFSAPIPEDYDLIKNHINLIAEYLQINYGSVEDTFMQGSQLVTGANILVGNSASSTNNHLEIFQRLSAINLENRKVIVPLSYGDADYRDSILWHGRLMLGEYFQPIVDFVPIAQYNTMVAECAVVIMGHRRQQAIGNIATMLFKGAKVYLDESTTSYIFFKKRGFHVFGLNQIDDGFDLFEPLTKEQQNKNRIEIEKFWCHEVVLGNAMQLVEKFKEGVNKTNRNSVVSLGIAQH